MATVLYHRVGLHGARSFWHGYLKKAETFAHMGERLQGLDLLRS